MPDADIVKRLAAAGIFPSRPRVALLRSRRKESLFYGGKRVLLWKIAVALAVFVMAGVLPAAQNLVIAFDNSSFSTGGRFERAKQRVVKVVEKVTDDDVFSVVTCDSRIAMIASCATAKDKAAVIDAISKTVPSKESALFAALARGAEELRGKGGGDRAKRMIVFSDMAPTIGPTRPDDIRRLIDSFGKEGISVTLRKSRREAGGNNDDGNPAAQEDVK